MSVFKVCTCRSPASLHAQQAYQEDPCCTDQAWIEAEVINYHDEHGLAFNDVPFNEPLKWATLSEAIPIANVPASVLHKVRMPCRAY